MTIEVVSISRLPVRNSDSVVLVVLHCQACDTLQVHHQTQTKLETGEDNRACCINTRLQVDEPLKALEFVVLVA